MAKDGNSLIMLGGLAVAGYFAYEYFFKPAAVAPAASNTGAGSSGTPGATNTASTPAASALDVLYGKVKADIVANADPAVSGSGDAMKSTPDVFAFYLARQYSGTIPDVGPLFSDRTAPITAAQFWGVMAPALKTVNSGLTGLGNFSALAGCGW